MVSHWVPLPTPALNDFTHDREPLRSATGEWTVYHFLYAECPCSRRVLEHIIARSPGQRICEKIVLVGSEPALAKRAEYQGFVVDHVTPDQLKSRYGVDGAPLMVVVDPQSQLRYTGGYTDRKRGFAILDHAIISELVAGQEVEPLPVYGCAVSRSLQAIVDPLQLKSTSKD